MPLYMPVRWSTGRRWDREEAATIIADWWRSLHCPALLEVRGQIADLEKQVAELKDALAAREACAGLARESRTLRTALGRRAGTPTPAGSFPHQSNS